jgi:hypothetical protein
MKRSVRAAVLPVFFLLSLSAFATSGELLSFQGIGSLQQVGNFYNGGGFGDTPNYGVTFSSNFYGLRMPMGSFLPTPTGTPAIFICPGGLPQCSGTSPAATTGIMNVANGFSSGINFFYAAGQTETVTLWSGANGTGTVLLTISLSANSCTSGGNTCMYNWSQLGKSFTGTAYSVTFSSSGPGDKFGLADITLGSSSTAIPEPSSIYLLGTGLGVVSLAGLRRWLVA